MQEPARTPASARRVMPKLETTPASACRDLQELERASASACRLMQEPEKSPAPACRDMQELESAPASACRLMPDRSPPASACRDTRYTGKASSLTYWSPFIFDKSALWRLVINLVRRPRLCLRGNVCIDNFYVEPNEKAETWGSSFFKTSKSHPIFFHFLNFSFFLKTICAGSSQLLR